MARRMGVPNATDCANPLFEIESCADFYEWNARSQITSWNPTPKGARKIPKGPIDYAGKQWQGLISDYYAKRATLVMERAIHDANSGVALNQTEVDRILAEHAFEWQTSTKKYPSAVTGDFIDLGQRMFEKYSAYFTPYC